MTDKEFKDQFVVRSLKISRSHLKVLKKHTKPNNHVLLGVKGDLLMITEQGVVDGS